MPRRSHCFSTGSLSLAAIAFVLAALLAMAQPVIKKVPISETSAASGQEMFQAYCASCHGADAKGNGPAAGALAIPPGDLTKLARDHGGEFPTMFVMQTLSTEPGTRAHGTAEMPIWGAVFRESGNSDLYTKLRIYNLTQYLESIQDPPSTKAKASSAKPARPATDVSRLSGSSTYRANCATCHGLDGKGKGPAAASLKKAPTDLTLLAKNNDGKYPFDHVMQILGTNPGTQAHGSSAMPVWGNVFRQHWDTEDQVKLRLYNVNKYIEAMQQ